MSTVKKPPLLPSDATNAAPHEQLQAAERSGAQGALTRQDIALAICSRLSGVSRREAKRIVDSVIDEMVATLTSGESLKLHDFGSFVIRDKHGRSGRNPRTGDPVPIQARRVVVFKASPNMKAVINGDAPPRRGAAAGGNGESLELDTLTD